MEELDPESEAVQRTAIDYMRIVLNQCSSGHLLYVNPTTFGIAVPHTKDTREIDLSKFFLPETSLVPSCSLVTDRTLMAATVLAIDSQLLTYKNSKAIHKTVVNAICIIAKTWEWGRIRNLYCPADWKPVHFKDLARDLSKGGFAAGLDLERRCLEFLKTKPKPVDIARKERGEFRQLRTNFCRMLGTNLSIQEVSCVRAMVLDYCNTGELPKLGDSKSKWSWKRLTVSSVRQILDVVNELARIRPQYRFDNQPYLNTLRLAKTLAKPNRRTRTLTVDQAVKLFVNSYRWIYERAKVAPLLVREITRIAVETSQPGIGRNQRRALVADMWERSSVRTDVEGVLGVKVEMVRTRKPHHGDSVSVQHICHMMMTSAFVLIAGMNGRRKDEICHPTLGLGREAILPSREDLGLFTALFYIEKTLQSYAPFYVNRLTYDSFIALRELEDANREMVASFNPESTHLQSEHSLFWLWPFNVTTGGLGKLTWYQFQVNANNHASQRVRIALGFDDSIDGTAAHMFRRFFAIIFIYRFEHGEMMHLRRQLAHANIEMTIQYVTDALITMRHDRIPPNIQRNPESLREVIGDDLADLQREIQEVADEKLQAMLKSLLSGGSAGGGFPKVILRLHRLLSQRVDYSELDAAQQANRVMKTVKRRGHSIRPMPHADCLAGHALASKPLCSEDGNAPAPENASPDLCSRCPLGWVSGGHVYGMKDDLKVIDEEIRIQPGKTILHAEKLKRRQNLAIAIARTEERIGVH